jgi:hypothetical protein
MSILSSNPREIKYVRLKPYLSRPDFIKAVESMKSKMEKFDLSGIATLN